MKKLLFLLSLCGLTFSQQIPVSVFVEAGEIYFFSAGNTRDIYFEHSKKSQGLKP